MKCVLLILDNSPVTSITGPMEILSLANSLVKSEQRLQLTLASANGKPVSCLGGLELSVHSKLAIQEQVDLILIGAIGHPAMRPKEFNADVIRWLQERHREGSKIASICTGAFVLAETGLLNGKQATTHWQCASIFRQRYPDVLLRSEEMITQQGNLYCSAGASAYQDMSLYLIREFYGDAVAQQCAKAILIDSDRSSQAQYASFQPSRQHNDEVVHQLQDWLRNHFVDDFSIVDLAKKVHLSERQLKRRFKQATSESPLAYIQALKIESAKHRLESSNKTIEMISRESGYEDVRFFRQLFKRLTGLAPSDYRLKFALR
jgi:transcriptional regulator GlxA family with amidase domain